VVLVAMQVSGFAVGLAFSDAYLSAATPLNWMLVGFPFFAANVVIGNAYLSTRQYDRLSLVCCAIAATANVAVVAWAVLSKHPNYAAFGVLASEGLGLLVLIVAITRIRLSGKAAPAKA